MNAADFMLYRERASGGSSGWQPGIKRAPLPVPPWPASQDPYFTTLPSNSVIPKTPSADFIFADPWWTTITPNPFEFSAEHKDVFLTYELHLLRGQPDEMRRVVSQHALWGRTHFMISYGDAKTEVVDGRVMTDEEFNEMALLVKEQIPYLIVALAGKNDKDVPHDCGWDVLGPILTPIIERMLASGALSSGDVVMFWETNLWQGLLLQTNYDGVHALVSPHGIKQYAHFSPGVSWWGPYNNRTEFWNANLGGQGHRDVMGLAAPDEDVHHAAMFNEMKRAIFDEPHPEPDQAMKSWANFHAQALSGVGDDQVLDGLLYQGDVAWDNSTRQAWIREFTNNPGAAPTFASGQHKFVPFEMDGMQIYNAAFGGSDASEVNAWASLCPRGIVPVSGACGGRRQNGDPILLG